MDKWTIAEMFCLLKQLHFIFIQVYEKVKVAWSHMNNNMVGLLVEVIKGWV